MPTTPPQSLNQPYIISNRITTDDTQLLRVPSIHRSANNMNTINTEEDLSEMPKLPSAAGVGTQLPVHCLNPASDINARLDTQVEVRVYPCNNNTGAGNKKKFTQFNVKPEVSGENESVGWLFAERQREGGEMSLLLLGMSM